MKAIFTGFAAFAVVLAVQPTQQPPHASFTVQPERSTASAEQIEAAVERAKADAGRSDSQ